MNLCPFGVHAGSLWTDNWMLLALMGLTIETADRGTVREPKVWVEPIQKKAMTFCIMPIESPTGVQKWQSCCVNQTTGGLRRFSVDWPICRLLQETYIWAQKYETYLGSVWVVDRQKDDWPHETHTEALKDKAAVGEPIWGPHWQSEQWL